MAHLIKEGVLSACVQELNLPGSPWHEVNDLISRRLADRIKLEGLTYGQMLTVKKFVGEEFIKKHDLYQSLRKEQYSGSEIKPRLTNNAEVQEFLKSLTLKAAQDAECVDTSEHKPNCYVEFSHLTRQIFSSYFEVKEQAVKYKNKDLTDSLFQLYTDDETNNLGGLVVNILRNDPSRLNKVIGSMQNRLLPPQLRRYLYRILLLKRRKEVMENEHNSGDDYNQKKLREDFALGVKTGLRELKCKNPTKTPINHLIQSSVIEVFENSVGLALFHDNIFLQNQLCRALNILYALKRKFSYHFVLWLLPLHVTLSQKSSVTKEYDYELAMYLDIILTHVQVEFDDRNQIALTSWKDLTRKRKSNSTSNENLRTHFWAMKLLLDDDVIQSVLNRTNKVKSGKKSDSGSMFSNLEPYHPVQSIRNWISHLFVGFLDLNISLYIWDQLFLYNWSQTCICRVCVVLVNSIATQVVECKEKGDLNALFLSGFGDLTLPQFIKVWKDANELEPL